MYRSLNAYALTPSSNPTNFLTYPYTQSQRPEEVSDLTYPLHPLQPRYPLDSRPKSPIVGSFSHDAAKEISTGLLSPPSSNASPSSVASIPSGITDLVRPQSRGSKLQSINDRVMAPYDYTEGYHFLMKHLPTRCVVLIKYSTNARVPWEPTTNIIRYMALFKPFWPPLYHMIIIPTSILSTDSRRMISYGSCVHWRYSVRRSLRFKCHCLLTMRYLWKSVSSGLCW